MNPELAIHVRARIGLTQDQMGKAIDCTGRSVSRFEAGAKMGKVVKRLYQYLAVLGYHKRDDIVLAFLDSSPKALEEIAPGEIARLLTQKQERSEADQLADLAGFLGHIAHQLKEMGVANAAGFVEAAEALVEKAARKKV